MGPDVGWSERFAFFSYAGTLWKDMGVRVRYLFLWGISCGTQRFFFFLFVPGAGSEFAHTHCMCDFGKLVASDLFRRGAGEACTARIGQPCLALPGPCRCEGTRQLGSMSVWIARAL